METFAFVEILCLLVGCGAAGLPADVLHETGVIGAVVKHTLC